MDRTPERTKPVQPVTAARRRLWQAGCDYVQGQGGWVTSVPFARFVRIDVKQGSPLPVQLEKAGHQLRRAGLTTRIGSDGFSTVASMSAFGVKRT